MRHEAIALPGDLGKSKTLNVAHGAYEERSHHSSYVSLASKRGTLHGLADKVVDEGDEFLVWGEWLEVAQLFDLIMLICTIGSMIFMPIIFYRYSLFY